MWYIDDLKVSHVNKDVVGEIMELMKKEFGKYMELTITQGKIHDYLGIQIDFSKKGKVIMSMFDCIDEWLKECLEDLKKRASSTGASNHLYNVSEHAEKLDNEAAILYHHLMAKLLYCQNKCIQICRHLYCSVLDNSSEVPRRE
jgi:hypothetical protein